MGGGCLTGLEKKKTLEVDNKQNGLSQVLRDDVISFE